MPPSLKWAALKWPALSARDPRLALRIVVGTLIALNLAAAALTFTPFGGGSGEDLRRQEGALRSQLAQLERRAQASRALVQKVDAARRAGDDFFNEYVMDARTFTSTLDDELNRAAQSAGIRQLASQTQMTPIEGSDTLYMAQITAGYEGTYAGLKKLVELLDKSQRFLIVDNMLLESPQTQSGQLVSVSLKLDAFVRAAPGAAL
jgi:type IV pilus assembly protein PilO